MALQILFSLVCIAIAIVITKFTVDSNRDLYGRPLIGWWIVGCGISQFCIIIMLAVWCKAWLVANQWIIYLSGGILIAAVTLGAVAKYYGRRHWYKFLQHFTPPIFRRSFIIIISKQKRLSPFRRQPFYINSFLFLTFFLHFLFDFSNC